MSLDIFIKDYNNLTEIERKIVTYISSNEEEVINSTTRELAEKLYISKTTLINLCKKLGFEGFLEMKYYLKQDSLEEENEKQNFNSNIKEKLYNEVEKTLELLDDQKVEGFSKEIINSDNLYVASRGTSKQVSISFCNNLNMLGIPAIFIDNFNLINVMKNHLGAKDTIVIISLSGQTKILRDLAKFSKVRNSKLLTITGFHANPIQNLSDYSLNFYSDITDTKYRDIHSRIGMNIVFSLVINKIDELLRSDNIDN